MRGLMVFGECMWINNPVATYKAEHKAVQLYTARRTGFDVPRTVITNDAQGVRQVAENDSTVAIKGLDTVLVWEDGFETFGYTSLVETEFAAKSRLSNAPLIAQEALKNKLDLRVTVVGDQIFCVAISSKGNPIRGDWRLAKADAEFSPYELPNHIAEKCIQITESLGLVFGAIDLAVEGDTYFFLEINPTGEWGWLKQHKDLSIDRAIVDHLLRK